MVLKFVVYPVFFALLFNHAYIHKPTSGRVRKCPDTFEHAWTCLGISGHIQIFMWFLQKSNDQPFVINLVNKFINYHSS